MHLFDSDILIDYLRLHPPAVAFLDAIKKKERTIALISVFELLKGCANKTQEARINRFLKHFTILPLNEKIAKTALEIYRVKRWAFGIGIVDCFIAATAIVNRTPLVSRNIKHYKGISSLKLETPY